MSNIRTVYYCESIPWFGGGTEETPRIFSLRKSLSPGTVTLQLLTYHIVCMCVLCVCVWVCVCVWCVCLVCVTAKKLLPSSEQ